MANTKSAKKMVRKIERRTLINKMRRSMVRTSVKKAEALIESGDKENARVALVAAERPDTTTGALFYVSVRNTLTLSVLL